MVLPDDPEEHVKFEEKSEDQEGADDATPLEGLLAGVTSDDFVHRQAIVLIDN